MFSFFAGPIFFLPSPAPVAHAAQKSSSEEQGSPRWDNNWCKASPEETQQKAERARQVPVPQHDPIVGLNGHLPQLWVAALASAETI
jgi:uncharacterized protein YjlB